AGLSIALAVTLLMLLWVQDEMSIDRYHDKGDRIYRVQRVLPAGGQNLERNNNIPYPLLQAMASGIPEIERVVPISFNVERTIAFDQQFLRARGIFGDLALFETFSYPILQGDIRQLDEQLDAVVISKKLAQQFFGEQWSTRALGETIEIEDLGPHTIAAIFADLPDNSSVKFEYAYSLKKHLKENDWLLSWTNSGMKGSFLLAEHADLAKAQAAINQIYQESEAFEERKSITVQAYAENYLFGKFDEQAKASGGRIEHVRMVSIAALLLLLISCINFVNLATARASKRAKEVGVRKTVGANKNNLIIQFMIEAALITSLSVAIAVLLTEITLPAICGITGKNLQLSYVNPSFWGNILVIILITTFLSGAYPSFVMSSFRPVNVLKGRLGEGFRFVHLRKGLVIIQFVLAFLLIVGAMVIQQQIHFIKHTNLGLEKDNLLYLRKDQLISPKYKTLQTELLAHESINAVTSTSHSPIEVYSSTSGVEWPGKRANQNHQEFFLLWAESNFLEAFDVSLAAGRFYASGIVEDTAHVIINQKAVEAMELTDPVGTTIQWWGAPRQIIGVVEDFHIHSLHNAIEPMAILLDMDNTWSMFVKTNAGQTQRAIAHLEKTFAEVVPNTYVHYEFVDEQHQNNYKSEVLMGHLANYFAIISIFISCLGLLGLAAFMAEQKTKEIGIRKVLGASLMHLITLLSKEFLFLVGLGIAIGFPISWYLLSDWLSRFAYKIHLEWWMFAGPISLAILIAGFTVGLQALRAALANPIQALRNE
ncbi:MAG: ABC transporter permease, partial [Bacteroidota bacterium]